MWNAGPWPSINMTGMGISPTLRVARCAAGLNDFPQMNGGTHQKVHIMHGRIVAVCGAKNALDGDRQWTRVDVGVLGAAKFVRPQAEAMVSRNQVFFLGFVRVLFDKHKK